MVKVRTSDKFFGMEIKEEATYGTDPAWPGASIPFIEDTLTFEDAEFAESAEFGAFGAWTGAEKGVRIVKGTIKINPRYNESWFWLLFGQGFGSEDLVVDREIEDDVTVATGLNTHIFSNLGVVTPKGLSARTFLQGPTNGAGTFIKRINGLICNKWTWEQPAGAEQPTLEMEFLGSLIAMDSGSGVTPALLTTTDVKVKGFDMDATRTKSHLKLGAVTMADFNVSAFTIVSDRGIETPEEYLNNALSLSKPGQEVTREITVDIEGFIEQDFHAVDKPSLEHFNDTATKLAFAYESATDAIAGKPYTVRFDMPNMHWTKFEAPITGPGQIPLTASGRAALGDVDNFDAPFNEHNTVPPAGSTDFRVLVHVDGATDEPSADTKFTALADAI